MIVRLIRGYDVHGMEYLVAQSAVKAVLETEDDYIIATDIGNIRVKDNPIDAILGKAPQEEEKGFWVKMDAAVFEKDDEAGDENDERKGSE